MLSQLPFRQLSGPEKAAFGEQVLLSGRLSASVAVIHKVRTLHILGYAAWCIALMVRYQRALRDRFSSSSRPGGAWQQDKGVP